MIYLLYGPDDVSQRSFLLNLRKDYPDQTVIDGKKQTADSIVLPEEVNLFGEKKLLIIESFSPKEKEPLKKIDQVDIAILTEELIIPPTWIDKSWAFKQAETLSNFKLADQVTTGQEKHALVTLRKLLLEKTPPELIVGSLVRQFRLISLALAGETTTISKSSFVQSKTKEQSRNWNLVKVKKALLLILKTDFEIKNGILDQESALVLLVSKICNLSKINSREVFSSRL